MHSTNTKGTQFTRFTGTKLQILTQKASSEPFSWPEPSADTSSEHPWVRAASKSVGPKVHVTGSAADNGLPEVGNPAFDWPQPQGDIRYSLYLID